MTTLDLTTSDFMNAINVLIASNPHTPEEILIDLSRIQRQKLERWSRVCMNAGEYEIAEELRNELEYHCDV